MAQYFIGLCVSCQGKLKSLDAGARVTRDTMLPIVNIHSEKEADLHRKPFTGCHYNRRVSSQDRSNEVIPFNFLLQPDSGRPFPQP